jgi:ATP/maltotriose-dependent transcriptional regulator MalT
MGIKDSRKIIKQLQKDNLFIVSLDDTHKWYRYHHLFSEFLRAGLEEEQKADMCRKASLWCRKNGFIENALEYALEAKEAEVEAKTHGLAEPLRKREIEILGLIAEGLSNDEIANKLFITTGTVKWHINNIFSKLAVNKRTQAVVKARRLNIIC